MTGKKSTVSELVCQRDVCEASLFGEVKLLLSCSFICSMWLRYAKVYKITTYIRSRAWPIRMYSNSFGDFLRTSSHKSLIHSFIPYLYGIETHRNQSCNKSKSKSSVFKPKCKSKSSKGASPSPSPSPRRSRISPIHKLMQINVMTFL